MIHAWRRASAAGGAAFLHTSSCEQVLQVWRRVLLRAAGRAVAGRRRGDRAERGRLAGGAAQVAVRRLRLAGALKRAGEMTRDCVRVPESTRDSVRWRSQTGRVTSGHLGSPRVISGHLGSSGSPRVTSGHLRSPPVSLRSPPVLPPSGSQADDAEKMLLFPESTIKAAVDTLKEVDMSTTLP